MSPGGPEPPAAGRVTAPFPRARAVVVDAGRLAHRRHLTHALVALDVTEARARLRALEPPGSMTAFLIAALGRAVAADPRVQAYRDWRGRLVWFGDVDVATLVEPRPGEVAFPHVVRGANRRSVEDLAAELAAVRARPADRAGARLASLGLRAPRLLRWLFFQVLRHSPDRLRRVAGTVSLTSVGMFGKGRRGFGIAYLPLHTLGVTVGGIAPAVVVHQGRIAVRELVDLTLSFDHDVVDGAPAARFAARLAEAVEGAEGIAAPAAADRPGPAGGTGVAPAGAGRPVEGHPAPVSAPQRPR